MWRLCALTALLIAVLGLGACAKKTPTLNLLVWEGYADPLFVKGFEEQCQCKVSASYMGSSDEMVAKLRGGSASNYDVISPSSDVATMIASAGLAAPLDLSRVPTYNQLSPKLTSLPLVHVKGNVYGVPFTWGPNPLIYDMTVFPKPPESWSVMWDAKYRGKISVWDDLSTVYMAAQILGYDRPDPNQLYNLSDEQLDAVKKRAARTEAERSQDVVDGRRINKSLPEPRSCGGHGLAAEYGRIEEEELSGRRNNPKGEYDRLD